METLSKLFVTKMISLTVSAGSNIHAVAREAALMALREDCLVQFTFNERRVTVNPDDFLDSIVNAYNAWTREKG